jgi:hypothetical protein
MQVEIQAGEMTQTQILIPGKLTVVQAKVMLLLVLDRRIRSGKLTRMAIQDGELILILGQLIVHLRLVT